MLPNPEIPPTGTPGGDVFFTPFLTEFTRPGVVTFLGVWHFVSGSLALVGAGAFLVVARNNPAALAGALVAGGFGGLQLACGYGLWHLKPFGRIIQIVLASIGLIGFPVGTTISLLILIYFFKPGVKLLMSGMDPRNLEPGQVREVAELAKGPSALLLGGIAIGAVVVLGLLVALIVFGIPTEGRIQLTRGGRWQLSAR